jgi:hypothetical protein
MALPEFSLTGKSTENLRKAWVSAGCARPSSTPALMVFTSPRHIPIFYYIVDARLGNVAFFTARNHGRQGCRIGMVDLTFLWPPRIMPVRV